MEMNIENGRENESWFMKVLDGLHLRNHGIIPVIPVRMTWRWRIMAPIHSSHVPYAILNASNEFTFSYWLIFIYVPQIWLHLNIKFRSIETFNWLIIGLLRFISCGSTLHSHFSASNQESFSPVNSSSI